MNKSEVEKYQEFVKKCNEKNRYLQKRDLIVKK